MPGNLPYPISQMRRLVESQVVWFAARSERLGVYVVEVLVLAEVDNSK